MVGDLLLYFFAGWGFVNFLQRILQSVNSEGDGK